MDLKQMVNGLREQINFQQSPGFAQSNSNLTSPRSAFSANNISPSGNNNFGHMVSPLDVNRLNQRVLESKKISRSLQNAFDDFDSGNGVSPIDLSGINGIHENHLIPGLVQDLQNLRIKLDSSVKKHEKLSAQLEGKIRSRSVSTGTEMATQTDLSVRKLQIIHSPTSARGVDSNSQKNVICRKILIFQI